MDLRSISPVLCRIEIACVRSPWIQAAAAIARAFDAELHIVHVLEPTNLAYGAVMLADLHSNEMLQMRDHARAHVADLGGAFDVPADRQHVVTGRAMGEIHRVGEAGETDLIVVGSHGRHGLGLLLGSTANGVLHGAKCDVLAVRVKATEAA